MVETLGYILLGIFLIVLGKVAVWLVGAVLDLWEYYPRVLCVILFFPAAWLIGWAAVNAEPYWWL